MRRMVLPHRSVWLLALPVALLLSLAAPWVLALPALAITSPRPHPRQRQAGLLRFGDSHIVSFSGFRRGSREWWHFQTYAADGIDPARREEWFEEAMTMLAALGAGAPAPSWGPLAVLSRGGGEVLPPHVSRFQSAIGWPFPSMAYWVQEDSLSYRLEWGWRPRWYANMAENRGWALPLRPIWPWFAVNLAVYWIAVVLAASAVSQTRRGLRIRRGRCPECAYPKAGANGGLCPECGWSGNRAVSPPYFL